MVCTKLLNIGYTEASTEGGINLGAIGLRAAEAVREMAKQNEVSITFETECIGVSRENMYSWEWGKTDPNSYALARMVSAGYDVIYILTGERK